MEGFVISHRHHSTLLGRRLIASCLSLFSFLLLSGAPSYGGQVTHKPSRPATASPDVSPVFAPGLIYYFAGDGPNGSASYSDGSNPIQVPVAAFFTASDSHGNVYIATSGQIFIVYAGGPVPQALKNITATPAAGLIYNIAGLQGSLPCVVTTSPAPPNACGEGEPLNMAQFDNISGFTIDGNDNLYYSDSVDSSGDTADVVAELTRTPQLSLPWRESWACPVQMPRISQ